MSSSASAASLGLRPSRTANGNIDFGSILGFTGEQAWSFEAWIFPHRRAPGNEFYEYFNKRDGTTNGIDVYVKRRNGDKSVTPPCSSRIGTTAAARAAPVVSFPRSTTSSTSSSRIVPGTGVRGWADGFKGGLGFESDGGPSAIATTTKLIDSLHGRIDEMAVYDYALSDDPIVAHYAKGRQTH